MGGTGQELQDGAKNPIAGETDPADIITVQIGIDLHDSYTPEQLTPGIVHNAVMARLTDLETAPDSNSVIPQK
jgi:hypothetical protein